MTGRRPDCLPRRFARIAAAIAVVADLDGVVIVPRRLALVIVRE